MTGGRTILLSYADERFRAGQTQLLQSALAAGFDEAIAASPADWRDTQFGRDNAAILSSPRGGGYWLWKPWLIREHLRGLGPGDVLFYCDASIDGFYRFTDFPDRLVERAKASPQGFVIGPVIHQHGPLSRWTKRDALVLLGADRPEILARPLVQATWSLWRQTPDAETMLDAWLAACTDRRILTDRTNELGLPDHPGFADHRHDQSVLSLIAYRDGWDCLDLAGTGIFEVMKSRPRAEMTHRFLKAPRNAERLLRGRPAMIAYWHEAIMRLGKRKWSQLFRALRRPARK